MKTPIWRQVNKYIVLPTSIFWFSWVLCLFLHTYRWLSALQLWWRHWLQQAKLASTQNKLDDVIAAAVTPAPTTTMPFDAPAFSYSCSDDGNAEADCPPTVNAVGSDVHISACCGSVAIHSADCSLNPCRLLAEVEDLKRRMPWRLKRRMPTPFLFERRLEWKFWSFKIDSHNVLKQHHHHPVHSSFFYQKKGGFFNKKKSWSQ